MNFYKRDNLPSNFYSFYKKDSVKPTKNSNTHHQSVSRLTNLDGRESGRKNLVGDVHKKQLTNGLINQFVNSSTIISSPLNWASIREVLKDYNINHDADLKEPYVKSLNRLKCKVTNKQVYVKYNPERENWILFKK